MDQRKVYRLLGSIARTSITAMNQYAKPFELDNNLFLYLTRIVEHEGLTQSELVQYVRIDKTTASRALKKLEAQGFIKKVCNPENKKFNQLFSTEKGQTAYNQLYHLENDYVRQALSALSPTDQLVLQQLLEKIDGVL
jgi:DNA-binding MarR family transcriptional regulator